jgi:ABC-2 type transport system ATP-binding protein
MRTEVPDVAPEPAVRLDKLQMVFANGLKPPVQALQGLTMEIPQGAVLGLLGPNGSGKTTAISCVLGLLRPQAGSVSLWGESVGYDLPNGADKRIGVLLEDTRLPPFLSVGAALTAVCRIRGFDGKAVKDELERVVQASGVERLLDRRVADLSKGQARRAGLAAALVGDPPLLILDEPSAGLDVSAREEFNVLVRRLRGGSRTVLIASHLLSDIESTCTHIAIIQAGHIVVHQTAEQLLREARQRCSEKDIHVDDILTRDLEGLGVRFEVSKYPGLVRLIVDEPEYELIGRLAAHRIVPARVEPRASLVSLYLELTRGGRE